MKTHQYNCNLKWTGNTGSGTKNYTSYKRDHEISFPHKKQLITASSDTAFLGDPNKLNPEELLVASISSCHMLWYLHLCATKKILVTTYTDQPKGEMTEYPNGSGRFSLVALRPVVTIKNQKNQQQAIELHREAHKMCFIANSCNFPIRVEPTIIIQQ